MSEEALLVAVRDRIRSQCGYSPEECDVQWEDTIAPNSVGYSYVAIVPGDQNSGPRHDSSGGVIDTIYSIQVAVIERAAAIPTDRLANLLLTNLGGINQRCNAIKRAIDFSYETTKLAASILGDLNCEFIHPFVWRGTSRMDDANSELFRGAKYNVATHQAGGVKKILSFGGARVTEVRR